MPRTVEESGSTTAGAWIKNQLITLAKQALATGKPANARMGNAESAPVHNRRFAKGRQYWKGPKLRQRR